MAPEELYGFLAAENGEGIYQLQLVPASNPGLGSEEGDKERKPGNWRRTCLEH